ncbi:MAG: ribonuclease J [Deferribacteraceae bacterium]|nr:ribonuclease J [Deferribacteraceae bacterium]
MNLKISCLGGAGEIGMNMYLYETPTSAVVVDCGVIFSDPQQYGVDSVLPDISYLYGIKDKLKAVLFTHGHEDHVGGAIKLLSEFNLPIFTGKFTAALLEHKSSKLNINIVEPRLYTFGDISVEFFPAQHSIPDTYGVVIVADGFSCLHLSDFSHADPELLTRKIDCLLLDSTNATTESRGYTEDDVKQELYKIFSERSGGRIFLTTFSSNVARLGSAIDAAVRVGRKVVPEGASMERILGQAMRMGLISVNGKDIVSPKKAYKMEPSELVYLVSGCQGEPLSALATIASGERKAIKMIEGDLLIFSSRLIPGSERNVNFLINSAMRRGVEVIQADDRLVHVSGHAGRGDLKAFIAAVAPKYFIPIHGEYRHLSAHRKLAIEAGVARESCLMLESGGQIQLWDEAVVYNEIPSGRVYIDGRGGYTLDESAVTMRKQIAKDGVVVVRLLPDGEIALETYGFTLTDKQERDVMLEIINRDIDFAPLNEQLARVVKRYFKKQLSRRPYIAVSD